MIIFQARYFLDSDGDTGMVTFLKNPDLWQVDNNIFPNGTVGVFFRPLKSFAGNLAADPLLADPRAVSPLGVRGFCPKDGSPARGAGVGLPEVTTDFDGKPRAKSGAISIGPFELN